MAKQTFTTGQVLTAAQMTSLQQTAMGGGSTTAKTTSYTLVAADAGTVVQMNSASATTITVNTALFAAGDTVQIQNIGAGVCTVTAGTATVNTSATLALSQYDAGNLYFNTTSAAFFFNTDAADSTGGMTLLSTTSLTGASTTISSISQAYTDLYVLMINATTSLSSVIRFDPNSVTGQGGFTTFNGSTVGTTSEVSTNGSGTTARGSVLKISAYAGTDWNPAQIYGSDNATAVSAQGMIRYGTPITSIRVATTAGTFSAGTVKIYGVK